MLRRTGGGLRPDGIARRAVRLRANADPHLQTRAGGWRNRESSLVGHFLRVNDACLATVCLMHVHTCHKVVRLVGGIESGDCPGVGVAVLRTTPQLEETYIICTCVPRP